MDDQQTREFAASREEIKRSTDTTLGEPSISRDDRSVADQHHEADGDAAGTIEQARTMARNVGEQAWNAAANAGTAAQDLARRAREQTSGMVDPIYQQGARAGEYLTRNINEYPLTALLVAGAVGYGLAYLIHGQWQAGDWTSQNWLSGAQGDNDRSGGNRRRREQPRR